MSRVLSPLKSPVSATTVVNCLSWSRADSILWRFTGDPDMASTAEEVAGVRRPTMPRVSWPIGAKLSEAPPLKRAPPLYLEANAVGHAPCRCPCFLPCQYSVIFHRFRAGGVLVRPRCCRLLELGSEE